MTTTWKSRLKDKQKQNSDKKEDKKGGWKTRWKSRQADPKQDRNKAEAPKKQNATEDDPGIDSRERKILGLLKVSLLAAGGFFILSNIRPYIDIVQQAVQQWASTGIAATLLSVPGVNLLLATAGGILIFVTAFLLWCVLQGLELLPTLMMDSPVFIIRTIVQIERWAKLAEKKEDTPLVRRLKARYNSIPEEAIERANIGRAIAYLIDGGICLWFYPPIQGGWGNFQLIASGAWDYLDFANVFNCFATLFAVEAVYHAYRLVVSIATNHFANN